MTGTNAPLARRLPPAGQSGADEIFSRFIDYVSEKKLRLYPAQEDALLEILAGHNVVLNTPTGSGKSLVAVALHFKAMAEGKRSFYTSPIKALASEKFFALCQDFGPENVGMLTGDAAINRDAPIVCCTQEILANMALREGHLAPVDYVVMDEFHYYSDKERGVAWQLPLLAFSSATFLLMSATFGETAFFEECLTELTGRPTVLVKSDVRPVPLDYSYSEDALHETVAELVKHGRAPVYIVNFTQRLCAEEAQNLMSVDYCTKEEKRAIHQAMQGQSFESPYGREVQKFLKHGVGLHHAGLLPRYRLLTEQLAQQGHLKIICGTDTLGVGVNIPIRTVLFTRLCKFDGEKTGILSVRDFRQISGRAGRKGFDDRGSVVVQAPEHVIENLRMESKAGDDPAKKRKIVRRKAPEKGYVHWDRATFERLVSSQPESLQSRFRVSHGMILSVLQREGGRPHDGCRALARLIRRSHSAPQSKRHHGRTALTLFASLIGAGVIRKELCDDGLSRMVVNTELQEDFTLNNTLSLYLVEAIGALERDSEFYPLDALSLVEAIMENPDAILYQQVNKLKTEKVNELKAQGVEYEKRMEELDKIEYPKPCKDFIYDTFNTFAAHHPWVAQEAIRPKSVAREIYETYATFTDYVRDYGIERSEGLLLRYLSDTYKSLVQTVPRNARTPELVEVMAYFRAMLKDVDSSLLDAWERLHGNPEEDDATEEKPDAPRDITRDVKGFASLVRRELHALLRALSRRDFVSAEALLRGASREGGEEEPWTPARLSAELAPYFESHSTLRVDHASRATRNTMIDMGHEDLWRVRQVLCDPDEDNDWVLECTVDRVRSREAQRVLLTLTRVGV